MSITFYANDLEISNLCNANGVEVLNAMKIEVRPFIDGSVTYTCGQAVGLARNALRDMMRRTDPNGPNGVVYGATTAYLTGRLNELLVACRDQPADSLFTAF